MTSTTQSLQEAIRTFDRAEAAQRESKAEAIRKEMLALFPLDGWSSMPLERYTLGQEDATDTYGRWIEFKSIPLGSISGGSSHKHIIFKRRNKPGWSFPQQFQNEREAWEKLRADFAAMLSHASRGEWDAIPELLPFQYGPALLVAPLSAPEPTPLQVRHHRRGRCGSRPDNHQHRTHQLAGS